jgi:hypothetical protein
MSTIVTAISPIWKVLLVGLVLGAGLPALFSVGIRTSSGSVNGDGSTTAPTSAGRAIAIACFVVVAVVVVVAILVLAGVKPVLNMVGLS